MYFLIFTLLCSTYYFNYNKKKKNIPKGFNNSCQLTATTTAVKIHGRISKERNKVLAFGLISVFTRSAKPVPIIR